MYCPGTWANGPVIFYRFLNGSNDPPAERKFGIPSLVVIISVIFRHWLPGLVGTLFAIPITLWVMRVFHRSDDLRWISTVPGFLSLLL
jgi:hypothetical protein